MAPSPCPDPRVNTSFDRWSQEGECWLEDADRLLRETQRTLRFLDEKERDLDQQRSFLEDWQRRLEAREELLLERERLLTDGLLQFESHPRAHAEDVLGEIVREMADLRRDLLGDIAKSSETAVHRELVEDTAALPPSLPFAAPSEQTTSVHAGDTPCVHAGGTPCAVAGNAPRADAGDTPVTPKFDGSASTTPSRSAAPVLVSKDLKTNSNLSSDHSRNSFGKNKRRRR